MHPFNNPGNQWSFLRVLCILIALVLCLTQIEVNASSSSSTCNSSSSSGCTLREWLIKLQEESYSLECTLSQLEKSTTLLRKVNYSTTSMRLNQITKLKKTISNLKGEIEIINLTCSTFYGPDCNITTPECNSKCLTCTSPGICSNCSGNWDGPTCSVCKSGWTGTNCNTPICDSKCTNCTLPGICSTCTGNWNGTTCSVCKSGWNGIDCNKFVNIGELVNSSILTNATHLNRFMNEIMNGVALQNGLQPTLLFRASNHGFLASTFHTKCDNKGANIVIVKSQSGAIFGGYTSKSWTSNIGSFVSDSSAFMFSLISSTGTERFIKLIQENGMSYKNGEGYAKSMYHKGIFGPTFGEGHNLYISDNANIVDNSVNQSHSNLCANYCDTTMTYGNPTSKSYLAGSNVFLVSDYEVYTF